MEFTVLFLATAIVMLIGAALFPAVSRLGERRSDG